MSETPTPTLTGIIHELDAGVFEEKALEATKRVVLGILATGKKGQVSITLDLEQMGDSDHLAVKHTLKFNQPTRNGKTVEESTTITPMYADSRGNLSVFPCDQDDLFSNMTINSSAKRLETTGVPRG